MQHKPPYRRAPAQPVRLCARPVIIVSSLCDLCALCLSELIGLVRLNHGGDPAIGAP